MPSRRAQAMPAPAPARPAARRRARRPTAENNVDSIATRILAAQHGPLLSGRPALLAAGLEPHVPERHVAAFGEALAVGLVVAVKLRRGKAHAQRIDAVAGNDPVAPVVIE